MKKSRSTVSALIQALEKLDPEMLAVGLSADEGLDTFSSVKVCEADKEDGFVKPGQAYVRISFNSHLERRQQYRVSGQRKLLVQQADGQRTEEAEPFVTVVSALNKREARRIAKAATGMTVQTVQLKV